MKLFALNASRDLGEKIASRPARRSERVRRATGALRDK